MLTIPNAVEEVIKKKPYLEGALVEGLINLSALARQLKPEIEKKVGKEVNVTRERIRQIEAKALRKLRHPSRSKKLRDFLD